MDHQGNFYLSVCKVSAMSPKIQFVVIKLITVVRADHHDRVIQQVLIV